MKGRTKNIIRAIISTLLMLSGGLSFISGGVLFFLKTGMLWIFTRAFLYDLHAVASLVMLAALIVHLMVNVRMYKNEIRALRRALSERKE